MVIVRQGVPSKALSKLAGHLTFASLRDPTWYNRAENYKQATAAALDMQLSIFASLGDDATWREEIESCGAAGVEPYTTGLLT